MSVRNLDSGDSLEVLDAGFPNPNGTAFSLVALINQDTVAGGDRACFGIGDASGNGVSLGCNGDGLVYADDDEFEGGAGSPAMATGEWWIVALTKAAAGAGVARLHAVELGGGSPYHANTVSITPTSFTPDRFTFGRYPGGTSAFDGKFAVTAAFTVGLTDQNIEDIATEASTAFLQSLSPHEIWHWTQGSIAIDLIGMLGTGANQFAISGTDAVGGSDPAWDFEFAGVVNPITIGATTDDTGRGPGDPHVHTTTAAVPPGAKIILGIATVAAGTVPTFTVTGGSLTWTQDDRRAEGANVVELWSAEAPDGLASGTTINAEPSQITNGGMLHAAYVLGVADSSYEDASAGDIRGSGAETTINWATGTLNSTMEAIGFAMAWGDGMNTVGGSSTPDGNTTELSQLFSVAHEWVTALNWRKRADAGALAMGGTWNQDPVFADGVSAVAYKAAATDEPSETVYQVLSPTVGARW